MKVLLVSMPDVVPVLVHEAAVHIPNLGIASIAGNIDSHHEVFLIDLVRKRRSVKKYVTKIVDRVKPDLVGLSAMAWQYETCIKIAHLVKEFSPETKVVIGGYHATLMGREIGETEVMRWVDFLVRGEGEEACRRLVNALSGEEPFSGIPSLSHKVDGSFVHNPRGKNLDLTTIRRPVRDKRRLTWGYHLMNQKIEALETSRGCTRSCNFCSMKNMYGRRFRSYPIARVIEDIDDIYYNLKVKSIFITDDNMVLNPSRVKMLCDAIIARNYKNLKLYVQADCMTMASNEEMVEKMALAGFKSVFLGIENGSKKNLNVAGKGDIVKASKQAIVNCHKYGMMVIGGLIFGFPGDDEQSIKENYNFFKEIEADAAYCQIITPYPKTGMRDNLLANGLITNKTDLKKYNGLWANVRTNHLSSEELQYQFWYQRQVVLGWWDPPPSVRRQGRLWIWIWIYLMKPFLKIRYRRVMKNIGWQGRFEQEIDRLERMNEFEDLEGY
jgi:radical SAM superfamily enzyme YgiQ (UPF0313 family)